jgi:hypothetical protein
MMVANFFVWWALMTFAISRGDIFGICLCCFGFLYMMVIIEEYEDDRDALAGKPRW